MKLSCRSYMPRYASQLLPGVPLDAFDLEWRKGPKVKLVIVRTRRDLHKAWAALSRARDGRKSLHGAGDMLGFCHQCWNESADGRRMVVDRRYAAVIVLWRRRITLEVVAHEAFHASMAILRRIKRHPNPSLDDMDDEEIAAYPAGRITHHTVKVLREMGVDL